jgi:hypothetical protein
MWMVLAISMTMLIVGASSNLAAAQTPSVCTATLSYPVIPVPYSNSNVPFVVPVSASCTTYYGTELYASGSAFDATSNTGLGTASAVLSSVNGGTEFNGQLGFNQFQASPSDSIQISVSIYNTPGGQLITSTGETVQLDAGVQQPVQTVQQITTTTTVTEAQNPYANPYPTAYPPTYQPNQSENYQTLLKNQQRYQSHPSAQTHYLSQGFAQRSNNTTLFDYAIIMALIAAGIIATAVLVLVARRQRPQPVWYPVPPPPR